ncbi:MAG TPA: alpha/beta hydrolase [Stellaceae bacterium]|nr:alpha/beta hydrolase [Stellaceae bacterium]
MTAGAASGGWVDRLTLGRRRPAASSAAAWPKGTRLIELPDATIRVREAGKGERVVLLTPDAPVVLENYDRLIDLLAREVRVVCFEFPGCGFSFPRWDFDFSLERYVGIVRGVMDALAIERATLAFTCVNASVAMAFARLYPGRVERLMLAQVAGVEEMRAFALRIDGRLGPIPLLHTPVLGQLFMMARRDFAARTWFRRALPKGFDVDSIWDVTRRVYERGGQFCMASIVQCHARVEAEQVTAPDCEAHVFWGDADRTHRETRKESVLAQLPRGRLHFLDERGHCPDIEAPDAYARLLLDA